MTHLDDRNIEDLYELSPMQQGMLFHCLHGPADSGIYIVQLRYDLDGDLKLPAFTKAFQQVVHRYPVLRTCFDWRHPEHPLQIVQRHVFLPIEQLDWRELSYEQQRQRMASYLWADRRRGFDLGKAPLMRVVLMRTANTRYQLTWTFHHMLLEGWSASLVLQDVFAFYRALSTNGGYRPKPSRPYRDYISWLKRQDLFEAETYWRETLRGFTAPTVLAPYHSTNRGPGRVEDYEEQEITLSRSATTALELTARQHHLTVNTLAQGAWAILLSRYTNQSDVVFGVVVSGRPATLAGAESMVGLFINTLPARIRVPSNDTLVSWLKQLQTQQATARRYEYSPLVEVQGWSDVPRGVPLFQSLFIFENWMGDIIPQDLGDELTIHAVRSHERGTGYPLTATVEPTPQLSLAIEYDRHCFDRGTIQRMLGHYSVLLQGMAAHPEAQLSTLPLLMEAEREQLLLEWNAPAKAHSSSACVQELFEAQVERTPDAVAVVFEEQRLSYSELNTRANQIANHLRLRGVGPENVVGVYMDRSAMLPIAIWGILKAGGAYLPMDANYPLDRLSFMAADAEVPLLLTVGDLRSDAERMTANLPGSVDIVCLDAEWTDIVKSGGAVHEGNPVGNSRPDELVYVIYTSGSTGQPKGTMVTHGNLASIYLAWEDAYRLREDTHAHLQMASMSFDVFTGDLMRAHCSGGKLVIARQELLVSPDKLYHLMQQEQVDCAEFVPVVLRNLMHFLEETNQTLEFMQILIAGSDIWYVSEYQRVRKLLAPSARLINSYGLTECTIDSTYFDGSELDLPGDRLVPIGRPFANTEVYVLDVNRQPVPIGVTGELWVGGAGLTRGYLNQEEQTAQRFTDHPFSNEAGARLYRTGDLARYLPDGNIEFLGRADHQVKLRGFRIELGEVESVLRQKTAVQEAVVIVREDQVGDERLVGYVVPEAGRTVSSTDLRKALTGCLPEYMVPSAFVVLESMPLTSNGKVDRRALPPPGGGRPDLEETFVLPRTSIERSLSEIWCEVLGLDQIGIHDNFFELGGHSLLAVQVISRIQRCFDIDVPVRNVFEAQTVEQLAEVIETFRWAVKSAKESPADEADDREFGVI